MSEHTPEPWDGKEIPLTAAGLARAGLGIVFTNRPATRDEAEANARRIVACVNACAGISTENLEDNKPLAEGLRGLNERIRMAEQQRDKLLAALEGLTDDICSLIDESSGVANLHLNGDIAFWSELEAGGQFERLTHLPDALRIIAEVKGQP